MVTEMNILSSHNISKPPPQKKIMAIKIQSRFRAYTWFILFAVLLQEYVLFHIFHNSYAIQCKY